MCEEKDAEFWCEKCRLCICGTCKKIHSKTGELKEHGIIGISEKSEEICEGFALKMKEVDQFKLKVNNSIKKRIECENQTALALKAVEKYKEDIVKYIDETTAKLLEKSKPKSTNRPENLLGKFNEAVMKYEALAKMVSNKTDAGIVNIVKQGKLLEKELSILWNECLGASKENCFKVEATPIKNPDGLPKLNLRLVETSGDSVDTTLVDEISIPGASILPSVDSTAESIEQTFSDVFSFDHLGKTISDSLQDMPNAVRYIDGLIFSCQRNGFLDIFNENLDLVSDICADYLGDIYDIVKYKDRYIIASHGHGQIGGLIDMHLNKDDDWHLQDYETFCHGTFCSVVNVNNELIVGYERVTHGNPLLNYFKYENLEKLYEVDVETYVNSPGKIFGQLFVFNDHIIVNQTNSSYNSRHLIAFSKLGKEVPSENWNISNSVGSGTYFLVHIYNDKAIFVDTYSGELFGVTKGAHDSIDIAIYVEDAWHSVLTPKGLIVQTRGKEGGDHEIILKTLSIN